MSSSASSRTSRRRSWKNATRARARATVRRKRSSWSAAIAPRPIVSTSLFHIPALPPRARLRELLIDDPVVPKADRLALDQEGPTRGERLPPGLVVFALERRPCLAAGVPRRLESSGGDADLGERPLETLARATEHLGLLAHDLGLDTPDRLVPPAPGRSDHRSVTHLVVSHAGDSIGAPAARKQEDIDSVRAPALPAQPVSSWGEAGRSTPQACDD